MDELEHCRDSEEYFTLLPSNRIKELQQQLPENWSIDDGKLSALFKFHDFRESMGFVNIVAALAEAENHHPDIKIAYNTVHLTLYTHSTGGLTLCDFILSAKISKAYQLIL